MNGRLIVIEGASDGIGKTTQIKLLTDHLKADKVKLTSHHFPTYYAYQGKGVEKYLAGDYGKPGDLSPYFINNLYAYDRAVTWQVKLKSAFEKGDTILLDRYTTSSLIYQSALITDKTEKKAFLDYVSDFEYKKLGIREPDQVIFLHAPLELVTKMRAAREHNDGVEKDIHETDLEFMRQVYENAMFVAKYLGWTMINCATGDKNSMRTPDDIHAEIYSKIRS